MLILIVTLTERITSKMIEGYEYAMIQRRRSIQFASILILFSLIGGLAVSSVAAQRNFTSNNVDAQGFPTNTLPPDILTQTGTLPPTETVVEASATSEASPTLTPEPSATLVPSDTATAIPTETELPVSTSTLVPLATPTVLYPLNPEPGVISGGTAIPTRMSLLPSRDREGNNYEIINFLMLGHDSESIEQATGVFRTDTMIIVSVNRTTGTVSMLSLPRDLYVYIPDWGMQRLNLAWGRGEAVGWTDGGFGLLRQTILYNFGIRIHYYAMVNFSGFKQIIDTLGGLTIPVDCPIQDFRWTGEYDENDEPTYEFITLSVGVYEMDSITALFYARSRKNSSDFDRGRRQQQILRAIWYEAKSGNYLENIPALYSDLTDIVETNIPIDVMIQLAPLALTLEPNEVENHFFRLGYETTSFTAPGGGNVQLPNLAMINTLQAFLTPPTENKLVIDGANIAIYDTSGLGNQMDLVAAERLIWEGLATNAMGTAEMPSEYQDNPNTVIVDYTGDTKGSSIRTLMDVLNIPAANLDIQPDPDRDVDIRIYLTDTYSSCVGRDVIQPVESTPTP